MNTIVGNINDISKLDLCPKHFSNQLDCFWDLRLTKKEKRRKPKDYKYINLMVYFFRLIFQVIFCNKLINSLLYSTLIVIAASLEAHNNQHSVIFHDRMAANSTEMEMVDTTTPDPTVVAVKHTD